MDAQEAWLHFSIETAGLVIDAIPENHKQKSLTDVISQSIIAGKDNFKASLREAIEKRIRANEENRDKELEGTIAYCAGELIVEESKQFLQLLDTIEPLKS